MARRRPLEEHASSRLPSWPNASSRGTDLLANRSMSACSNGHEPSPLADHPARLGAVSETAAKGKLAPASSECWIVADAILWWHLGPREKAFVRS
jgi:hypothetical protein